MRTKNNFIKIKTENHIKRYYLYEISKKKKEGIKMMGSKVKYEYKEKGDNVIWQE
jgi:hypothetical protein